jgi:hypothetical protein
MSRRTEMAYKAQSPGKLARHNEAQGSGDRVNAAVVSRKFTFLSGEICPTWPCGAWRSKRPVRPLGYQAWAHGDRCRPMRANKAASSQAHIARQGAIPDVIGQKSAEAIVAQRPE